MRKVFRLVLIRHEKPFYKDEGHDLTPEGVEKSKQTGRELISKNIIDPKVKTYFFSSPKPRAIGTLNFIIESANLKGEIQVDQNLRSSDFTNLQIFLDRKNDLGFSSEQLAKEHFTNHDFFNNSPHIIETNDSKKKRMFVFLDEMVSRFGNGEEYVQIIAVSHFEVIMHLIDKVFGIESFDTYLTPKLGEVLVMDYKDTKRINTWEISFRGKNGILE